jgi:carboxylesterase
MSKKHSTPFAQSEGNQGALALFAKTFTGPEHEPFCWSGGETAVLLVHGFPGTPAEIRPMARVLHDAGYAIQGILLPGFGPQFASLPGRAPQDWVTAVIAAVIQLRATHSHVVLLGLSMGGAIALQAAVHVDLDGLILAAPFHHLGGPAWMGAIWPAIRPVVARIRPFRLIRPDFSDPHTRSTFAEYLPGLDPDDPAVQQALRNFSLPVALLEKVAQTGEKGYEAAAVLPPLPLLVLQGADDEVVIPSRTAELRRRLPEHTYVEVPGDHRFLDGKQESWPIVQQAVLDFLSTLPAQSPSHVAGPS